MAVDFSVKGLENALRLSVPLLFLAGLFVLSVVSLPLPDIGVARPGLLVMAVYYWSVYRPTLMPPYLCFMAGLLLDFLIGLPLGVNAVILTLVQWIVRDQRRFLMGQAYIVIWLVFALVAFTTQFMQWGMYGLVHMQWAPVLPQILAAVATTLLFPVVTLFLILIHRVLPAVQKAYE